MKKVDLLIHNAAQLLTCASPSGVKRGNAMRDVGIMRHTPRLRGAASVATNGAVAIANGQIVAVGESSEVLATFSAKQVIDASGKTVMPGFARRASGLWWKSGS